MSRAGKWITGTNPEQPISKVARRALSVRLAMVWHYARLTVEHWEETPEHVHLLRVATRRAQAALQIFADLLPRKDAKWITKRLRQMRRAAGRARDLDVLCLRLTTAAEQGGQSRLDPVVEQLVEQRRAAQKPLVAVCREAKRKEFPRRARQLAKAARWEGDDDEPTFAESARDCLVPLVQEFFTAAEGDLREIRALHQMRIAGKRVRYAIELLSGALAPERLKTLRRTFGEVQEKLGDINDHATASAMFQDLRRRVDSKKCRAELSERAVDEQAKLDTKQRAFRRWWSPQRQAALRRQFVKTLRAPALAEN